jgi:hypothetical protein
VFHSGSSNNDPFVAMATSRQISHLAVLASLILAGCGGSGTTSAPTPPPPPPAPPPISDAQRSAAATETANTNPACASSTLGSFYWEIGDADGAKVSGQVGSGAPTASTDMAIASASKWVYATYALQKVGSVRSSDVPYLNFTSGYTDFLLPVCAPTDTVASCLRGQDSQEQSTVGKFFYGSGHMQVHAETVMNLGAMGNSALTNEVSGQVGTGFGFEYVQPQLAGGLAGNAAGYAGFLRRMLRGELVMASALGSHKVCTNPNTCTTAMAAPIPDGESWNYSLGHWVEDDPVVGDHAFSSAGAFGFYPWINANKTLYGVLARRADNEENAGYNSARCGRLIRQAWVTGETVTSTTPTP